MLYAATFLPAKEFSLPKPWRDGVLRVDQYLLATVLTHLAVLATDGPTSKQLQSTIVGVLPHLQSVAGTQGPRMNFYQMPHPERLLIAGCSASKGRGKALAISTGVFIYLIKVASAVCIPYAINGDQFNLREKLAFVFMGTTISCPA